MPQISVILPVYNAERYLDVCLKSIVSQSFSDWECICVNDGSTDISDDILKQYKEKDNRFSILYQDNSGPSVARNSGLAIAKGEYILFMDADDFVESDGWANLVEMMEREHLDLLGFSYKTYPDKSLSHFSMKTGDVLSPTRLLASTLIPQSSDDFSFAWRYMIRRSVLEENHIEFDSRISVGEDTLFMMKVFSHVNSVYLTDYAPYKYRVNNEQSIMHAKKYNPNLERSLALLYEKKKEVIIKNNWDELTPFSFDLAERVVKHYCWMLMNNRKANGEPKEQYIREVLLLPMMQDAMKVIGFRNIFGYWKEYVVYLCMKCCFMPILKRYF